MNALPATKPALKPCPFCGSPPLADSVLGHWDVDCSNRECAAFAIMASVEQWNHRAPVVIEYGAQA